MALCLESDASNFMRGTVEIDSISCCIRSTEDLLRYPIVRKGTQ